MEGSGRNLRIELIHWQKNKYLSSLPFEILWKLMRFVLVTQMRHFADR